MAQYKQMSEEESLKRSHSPVSNFKLTLVCMLLALSATLFVGGLAAIGTDVLPEAIPPVITAVGGALTVISLFLISRFKR